MWQCREDSWIGVKNARTRPGENNCPGEMNKHFESSQKLLKSSFVNERFKKYSMLPNELLTFETTNFKNLKYY